MTMLTGSIVSLGPLEQAHLQAWRGWVNDLEIASLVDRVLPVSEAEHERFFERHVCDNATAVWFSVLAEACERHIGNAWLWNIDQRHRRAEVRVLIGEREHWDTGAGAEAIALLTDFAFEKMGLHKIYAYVMERNPRARRAFEKALFIEEAVLREETYWDGGYHTVWRMMRLRAEKTL
jgi:RimJ/RimL family protein N-acetyltransferase